MASSTKPNFLNLKGKVVIITGASSGIGEATAIEFARQGSNLMLCGREEIRLHSVAVRCFTEGEKQIKVECVSGDILSSDVQSNIVDKTIEVFGKLDVLVNNAGASVMCNPMNTDHEVYNFLMKTNVESVFFLTQLALPHLIKTEGNIVNMSSFSSSTAAPAYTVYAMTKAAIDSYTKSLSLFLAPQKVRVNAVNPASVVSLIYRRGKEGMDGEQYEKFCRDSAPLHPLGSRLVLSSEVADAVVFLASERASFITGETLCVDGGRHIFGAQFKN